MQDGQEGLASRHQTRGEIECLLSPKPQKLSQLPKRLLRHHQMGNPYGGGDEYKWTGPFTTRKAAAAAGKRIHDRGPSRFVDWMKCARPVTVSKGVAAFAKAASKVGMNPNLSELDLRD